MKIRKFKKEDAKKASYMIRKSLMKSLPEVYNKKVIDFLYKKNSPPSIIERSKERDYFVAQEENCIIGIVGLKGNEVKSFFVNPRYFRKGIGTKLLKRVEKEAKKKGIKKLIVHGSLFAEGFYKKVGFKEKKRVRRGPKEARWTDILMEKKI